MYGKNCNLRTLSREYDCLAKIGTKGNMRQLKLTFKDKNIWKKSSFVADINVIGS